MPDSKKKRLEEKIKKLRDKAMKMAFDETGRYDTYHSTMNDDVDRRMYNLEDRADKIQKKLDEMDNPIKKALVGNQDQLPDQLKKQILAAPEESPVTMKYSNPIKMYDDPIKYMVPMASEGSGFKMHMGSKEKHSEGNFSQKDSKLISQAPALMKDNYGGESIELKDQENSPMTFKGQTQFKKEAPSQAAWALKMADKRTEQNAQGLQNALSVAKAGGDVISAAFGMPPKPDK